MGQHFVLSAYLSTADFLYLSLIVTVLQELFEKTVSAMADIPKEAIFSGPASGMFGSSVYSPNWRSCVELVQIEASSK